ncbi:hypothetical protein EJP82_27140 [Paenibacillus anaericanus]|uniref:Fibronectin type-III domain-containing protein n=1 Tax=Paenibacillus anaericanus TaxID=170367 RepID=A0A3S1BCQ3_9BACL|nr:hypothetical protein [Paenibacillus anaericanus]RUT38533.1 hypothetical protein EJP82_27140 [Paenibacillus anaericanus]
MENQLKIHYRFDDRGHAVNIKVYRNGSYHSQDYQSYNGSLSGTYEFTANNGNPNSTYKGSYYEDGIYKFVITPAESGGEDYSDEVSVKVYQDRIIFIPGIMGSELLANNKNDRVWLPDTLEVYSDIAKIAMGKDGKSIYDISPGKPLLDWYMNFDDYFTKQNYKVINYGYDWRLSVKENASLLKPIIDKEINNKIPEGKIFVVAHSMGGLVATEYINQGNGKNIDKLITLGTPYLGAPKAVQIFETGQAATPVQNYVIAGAIRDVMPNIISAYQLLPTREYFINNNSYISREDKITPKGKRSHYEKTKIYGYDSTIAFLKQRTWYNNQLMEETKKFHENLNVLKNLNSIDSYYIIGDQIPTVSEIVLANYETYKEVSQVTDIKTALGDGTVPLKSANVKSQLKSSKVYYIKEEHGQLANNTDVQKQVLNILKNQPNILASGKIHKEPNSISVLKLKIDDSPVTLDVYDLSGNHTGPINAEKYETKIPYGQYYEDSKTKFALLEEGNYNVRLKGTSLGIMNYSLVWTNGNDVEEKTIRFDEVEVTPTSIFTSGTNRDGQIVLQIDDNGDGIIDRTLSPSVELDLIGTQDETIPTITSRIDGVKGVNEWYGKNVYYNLIGEDSESGVYKSFYNLNESGFKEYTAPIPLPDTGIYIFESFVRDKNRNDSEILRETVKVDTTDPTKPTMTIVPLKWTNQFVSITLSDSEDADSGFQKYQYKIGQDGEWKDYTTPVIIDTEGLYNVYARAVDNVFNLSEEVSGDAKVDKTRPTTPKGFEILSYNYNQIKISWLPSTDNVEVTGYDVYQNSVFIGSTTDTEFTFNNLVANRSYTFTVVARDEATNSSLDGIFVVRTPKSMVGTGIDHTLQVKSDGKVLAWGFNNQGQLGDGTTSSKTTAVEVPGLTGVLSVAAGTSHSLALKSDGTVWSWGSNGYGQLGNGAHSLIPVQVKNLSGITGIAANGNTSYALKGDGTVWSWGSNDYGQLGDGTTTTRTLPVQAIGVSGVSELAAGYRYVYALRTDGTVYGWGVSTSNFIPGASGSPTTKAILMTGLTNIASIGTSNGGLALKKDGSVVVWGGNYSAVTPVNGLSGIESIAGGSSNYAIAGDGSVWNWKNWTNDTPIQMAGLSDIDAVAVGKNHAVASKADGSTYAWGSANTQGELGDGTTVAHSTPALVQLNTAPQVTLTYPIGSQSAPEESHVSNPSIRWTQEDVALTNFAVYQVQVLDASGAVVVDSGEVKQATTAAANAWTVTKPLPSGQAYQIQVRVNDEHLWSEWSSVGWIKYSELSLRGLQHQMAVESSKRQL